MASTFHLNFLHAPLRAVAPRCSDAVLSSPTSLWVQPLVAGCRVRLIPKAGNVIASEAGAGETRLPRESSTFRKLSRGAWRRRPRPSLVCLLRSHRTAADAPAPLSSFSTRRAERRSLIILSPWAWARQTLCNRAYDESEIAGWTQAKRQASRTCYLTSGFLLTFD